MPTGVYHRTEKHLAMMRKNFALGRLPEVRKKVARILKKNASNPAWREMVSEQTRKAMREPEIRERHLAGLKKARETHGVNFKGGNGQTPVKIVQQLEVLLKPQGFIREYLILTTEQRPNFQNAANAYKVDFGNPKMKIAIEVDGPSHRGKAQQAKDQKKTRILEALGWTVLHYLH